MHERRLTTQGKERKRQLMDCAARLFAERGYAETRVIDIVREAGVAKGLFYWYFENKEALFRELVETTRHRLRVAQAAAMDPDADPLLMVRQGSVASVRFMAEHAHLYTLLRAEGMDRQVSDLLRQGTEIHTADTAALIQRGIAAGLIRDEDPTLLAYGVLSTVAYYTHFHRTRRIDLDVAELAEFVGRFLVRSLAADDTVVAATEAAARAATAGARQ